jgi:hypothetical protein
MKNLAFHALIATLLLSGCASRKVQETAATAPVFRIVDAPASVALTLAASHCPAGYRLLGEPRLQGPSEYDLTIQCN